MIFSSGGLSFARFDDSAEHLALAKACFSDWPNAPTTEQIESDAAMWAAKALEAHYPLTEESNFMNALAVTDEASGELVAIIRYEGLGQTCHVAHHLVHPMYRQRGYHTKMVKAAFAYAFEMLEATDCVFQVLVASEPVLRVGRKWGYKEIAKTLTGNGQQVRHMQLTRESYMQLGADFHATDLRRAANK